MLLSVKTKDMFVENGNSSGTIKRTFTHTHQVKCIGQSDLMCDIVTDLFCNVSKV